MNVVTNNKWIGQRTIRPDGVDKVTGRAAFAADTNMPGMIWGKVKRSPHPHARIKSIDTSKAEALPGVKAVVTARDIVDFPIEKGAVMLGIQDMRWMCRNVMARDKALFPGHPIAAVAATTEAIAAEACKLIEVDYEVLPWSIEIDDAILPDAPILHEFNKFDGKPSNIAGRLEHKKGDIAEGFKKADIVIERTFSTRPVHQGYIEPHACLISVAPDGKTTIWSSSQGQFMVRAMTSMLTGIPQSDIRAIPAEIGGGFGGKTIVYLEPVATLLAKKSGQSVKIVMSRDEVFKASGPTSGSSMRVKIGVKKDGTITAAEGVFKFQAGAFPGSPVMNACMCAFAPYNIPNQHTIGYDVVCNRPKSAAYRAPGSPISAFAAESVLDILAKKIGMDPLQLRLKNAARAGTPMIYGPKLGHGGYVETVEALVNHPAYKTPLGPNQGRGVASGYWFNGGGESSASVQVNEDGTVIIATGSPDIGGSRASMALMAAETLGIDYHHIRSIVADTSSVGYTHVTGGSRVTFATGMAVVEASKKIVDELRARAAIVWDVDVEGVVWEDGQAKPASSNVGDFAPLSFKELAAKKALTGGPITAAASVNAGGMAPGFSTQFCDVEVDPETGKVTILRFVAAQDVGCAIHPSCVEGQIQGGVAQGVGWALNEEYIYDRNGRLDNAGFLDYRVPVASDMPMIEPILVEVPNPAHPYGAKGVGEVNIVPPMAAIANAIDSAIHRRLTELPRSPPKIRAALDHAGQADD